jgi:hypothetical protein
MYSFCVDTGAKLSVVGEGWGARVECRVGGITVNILKTEGYRNKGFQLGRQSYRHNYIIAPFPMKRDGIIGLDLQRAVGARLDLVTNRPLVGGEEFPLGDARLCAFSNEQVRKMSSEERN